MWKLDHENLQGFIQDFRKGGGKCGDYRIEGGGEGYDKLFPGFDLHRICQRW